MGTILVIAYLAWSLYSGWKFLTGRNEWLDQPKLPNKLAKFFVSGLVGVFVGVFYFFYWAFKLLGKLGM